jgi:phosphate transport system substrate-binding protein
LSDPADLVKLNKNVIFFVSLPSKRVALVMLSLSSVFAVPARAQLPYLAATFYGGGDAPGGRAIRQMLDCHSQKRPLLNQGGLAVTLADFQFMGLGPASPDFNCATSIVQPQLRGWFISSGPSGQQAFIRHEPALLSPYSVGLGDPDVPFAQLHFGLSASGNIDSSAYQPQRFGPLVQFPLFAVPVTIAYDPVYAKVSTPAGLIEYRFTLKLGVARSDGSGGLRLDRNAYCAIFNPADANPIVNWNDARLRVLNGNASLQDPAEATAGVAFNVPIRLVGRTDSSATTAFWTRHLAAACGTSVTNSFVNASWQLPAATYSSATFNAGTVPAIAGAEQSRLYMSATGATGLAQAIDFHPAPAGVGGRSLNGKIGYLEPDQVLPAVNTTLANPYFLATASLKQGTLFVAPSPANATKALNLIVPPQSTVTGVYNPTITANGNRSRPTDWLQRDDKSAVLALPTAGYPITGTSNASLHTCYADPKIRLGLTHFFSMLLGKVKKDSDNVVVAPTLLTDPVRGVLGRNGFGALPAAWAMAVSESFFKKSTHAGLYSEAQGLRFVATGSRTAYYTAVMDNDERMFRQRTPHVLAINVGAIRIGLMNWFTNGSAEAALDNDVTYNAVWIERGATGEVKPITFLGQRSVTLAAGSTASHVSSDPLAPSVWSTPPLAGETFWVHMVGRVPNFPGQRTPSGGQTSFAGAAHKRYPLANDAGLSIDYAGPVPTIPGYNGSSDFGVPLLFLGQPSGCCSRAVAVIGDSISQGVGDTDRATLIAGIGYAARASVNDLGAQPLAVAIMARTGESGADFLNSADRRLDLMTYADIAHVAYGTNDIGIGPGTNPVTLAARLRSIRALIRSHAPNIQKITSMSLLQRTFSSDLFATLAGQTSVSTDWATGGARDQVNALLQADVNLPASGFGKVDAYFNLANPVLAPNDQSRWNANGVPRTWVIDGVHPSSLAHKNMGKIVRAGWLALSVTDTASTSTTLGQRNLWINSALPMTSGTIAYPNPLCANIPGQ